MIHGNLLQELLWLLIHYGNHTYSPTPPTPTPEKQCSRHRAADAELSMRKSTCTNDQFSIVLSLHCVYRRRCRSPQLQVSSAAVRRTDGHGGGSLVAPCVRRCCCCLILSFHCFFFSFGVHSCWVFVASTQMRFTAVCAWRRRRREEAALWMKSHFLRSDFCLLALSKSVNPNCIFSLLRSLSLSLAASVTLMSLFVSISRRVEKAEEPAMHLLRGWDSRPSSLVQPWPTMPHSGGGWGFTYVCTYQQIIQGNTG